MRNKFIGKDRRTTGERSSASWAGEHEGDPLTHAKEC